MKRNKVTLKSLKERIVHLESELSKHIGFEVKIEKEFRDHLNQLGMILERRHGMSPSEIQEEVSHIKGRLYSEGMMIPIIEHNMRDENSKLWYLMRVVLGDKGREEPFDPGSLRNKFREPNF